MEKEINEQIKQVCELCPSKYCVQCKISVKTNGKNFVINGVTRKIERVEKMPSFA